ncbi:MAG: hypothetical protein V4592_08150 [Bacteroidota bacterium]
MPLNLDEKKHVIIALLDELRPYESALGSYVKSMYTTDFDYSVKLSNGKIRIPEELVDDYERAPAAIAEARYRRAAAQFIADHPVEKPAAVVVEMAQPLMEEKKSYRNYWRAVLGIVLVVVIAVLWYNAAQDSNVRNIENAARVDIYNQIKTESSPYMVNRLFGGISDLKVTVTNNSAYLVDIVKVKVTYIKADGGVYKEEMLYFNQLGAHSTQTLDAPNSNRGTRVRIARESLVCSALAIN